MTVRLLKLDAVKATVPYAFVGGPFGSNLTTRDYTEEGVPVIRGSNLASDSSFVDEGFVFVSEKKANDLRSNIARPGDLLFTQRGTLGQVGLIPAEPRFSRYVISQSQMKLTVDCNIADSRFIYQFFRLPSTIQKIINHGITSGVPHINLGILKDFTVPFPDILVQRRIADILTSYDDLIENNRRRIALLEEAVRQLYEEWFVRRRFPGYEHTSVVNSLPQGWSHSKIKDLTSFLKRGVTPHYDDEAPGLVINQKCIRNRRLNLSLARHQSREFKSDRQIQAGDVLVNSTGEGTLGRVAQVFASVPNCTVDTHVTIVRPSLTQGTQYFGQSLMALESVLSTMGRGATNQTELSPTQIGEIKLLVPSKVLLQQFEERSSPIVKMIYALSEQNVNLTNARDLLRPRLMSGEIAV